MHDIRRILFDEFVFPRNEHRIAIVQLALQVVGAPAGDAPFAIRTSPRYVSKLRDSLRVALEENWANVVVLPEISTPAGAVRELLEACQIMLSSRPEAAGGCLIVLPLEHVSQARLAGLASDLLRDGLVKNGDPSTASQPSLGQLFSPLPPAERTTAFVNVALVLVTNASARHEEAHLLVQPKLFPYPGERAARGGRFLPGVTTYLLELGNVRVMTAICYDLIAQPPGMGIFLGSLLEEARRQFGDVHYLLAPQCNPKPLDHAFQDSLADLYHRSQVSGRVLRVASANASTISIDGRTESAGHSWFVTCPLGNRLPDLGLWERSLVSVLHDPSTQEVIRDAPSLGHYARRLRLSAPGEWLLCLGPPPSCRPCH